MRREEQSYAKMTQKEKEEQELSKREKAIAKREKAQALKELKSDVVDDLKEQELPTSFADALIKIEDNEEIKDVIRQIKKTLIVQLEKKSKKLLVNLRRTIKVVVLAINKQVASHLKNLLINIEL